MSLLDDLSQDYRAGKFKGIETDLEKFFYQHKNEIQGFKNTLPSKLKEIIPTDELAAKLYIMQTRSLNPVHELRLELEEIEKEIWYRGEKSSALVDRERVAQEWTKQHARGWRDHYTMVALYLFEQNKEKYLKIIQDPPPNLNKKTEHE